MRFGTRHPPPVGPRSARLLTLASLRWVMRHRAYTPWHLVRYWRFFWLRMTQPGVICEGMVFLDRGTEIRARPGYGRLVLGRWVHVGKGSAIRAHEGTLRIGHKVVIGQNSTINSYLDLEIGEAGLIADWVYISDFDHKAVDLRVPIKDQGIVKTPVRIDRDCWIGTKATITRGVRIGEGSIVGANAVVTRDVTAYSVVGGVPARLLRSRRSAQSARRVVGPLVRSGRRAVTLGNGSRLRRHR